MWETMDAQGNVVPFEEEVLIHSELPHRLVSPQAFLLTNLKGEKTGDVRDHFRIYHDRCEWFKQGSHVLSMQYDTSFLPRITLFPKGQTVSSLRALNSVLHNSNRNMSPLQRMWALWHNKLGHLSFAHVQKLGLGGFLDRHALGLLRTTVPDHPTCTACQYGKQTRKPDGTTTTVKNPHSMGSTKAGKLTPGSLIFCDQLESRVRGRLFHTAGREAERNQFCGSSVFYDAASMYLHVEHQVTLNASDSIVAKENFERMAMESGVNVESYHTDNGIFKCQAYVKHLADNFQSIKYSGVGAKWQSPAEGAIRIVVTKARTMMIHAALHWPEVDDESLWPMALNYSAHLYNHTPNFDSGIAPVEIFTGTLSDHQALRNAHTWGCPVYVLEPRLTEAGGKIPKWQPRSRRAQFVGVSPHHAENIGLVRNLTTGYLSPQFHLVYDDLFETVYSNAEETPQEWTDLCIFHQFETVFDEGEPPPSLSDEWLTPEEQALSRTATRRKNLRSSTRTWQSSKTKDSRDDFTYEPPPQAAPRVAPELPRIASAPSAPLTTWTREAQSAPLREASTALPVVAPPRAPAPAPVAASRYPRRAARDKPVEFLSPDPKLKSYHNRPSSLLAAAMIFTLGVAPPSVHMLQAQVHGYDPILDTQESFSPGLLQSPLALKAKVSNDPDLPSLRDSLTGPFSENFWSAMDDEIGSLESKGTWKVVDRSSMPSGTTAVPGTWVQRIKRLPDGELNKFKSRWCCRGDLQAYDGVAYSPLVGWPTVRAGLLLASAHGWKSRQVDFTLAFCQSPQPADNPLFMELPQYYRPKGCEGRDVVLEMQKSIYGQIDSPKLFYEHLCRGMTALGFEATASDPCCFIHKEHQIMVLNYCDDQIWLSPDNDLIETYVAKLKNIGYDLTLEDQAVEGQGDIFGFLGINFEREGANIELTQAGLTQKVIKYLGMEDASSKLTPAATDPLGSDKDGEDFDEEWSYPAAVGMLLYLSSNTRPDITFAVHQAARFSHRPKKSHAQAVKRIIRYLIGTSDRGICFVPDLTQGLDCYVDADFAGLYGHEDEQDPTSVKSRTGFVLTLFGCPIIWQSKIQSDITLSSTAAEYVAFSMAMRELLPMRALLKELGERLKLPVITNSLVRSTVFEDNQGCISLVNVPKMSARNKYLNLKYHFFRSALSDSNGQISAVYVSTLEQKADIFTKGLPSAQFATIRKLLMGW